MINIKYRIQNSAFIKNSLTLSGGVAIAQVLPFLFYPILGRIFTAEEFGLLASLTSITSVLAVVGSGKYESAILIARDKHEAASLAVLAVLLGFVTMLIAWLLMQFVLIEPLSKVLDEPALGRWIFVCPLASVSIIIFTVYNEWCVRETYFKSLSVNKIVNAAAITLSKTFLGFVKVCSQGLVVGDLIGRVISAVGCVVRALLKDGKSFASTCWADVVSSARRYREFPCFTMPGQLLNTVGQAIPILFITAYFGKGDAGQFSMAMTLFAIPINVISTALRDVYRQRANEELRSTGSCRKSFDRMLLILSAVGIGALLLFVWFLPWLMKLFLGPQWVDAGHYAQILAPAMVLSFISGPMTGMFVVAEKLRAFFWWQVLYAAGTLVAIWIGCGVIGTLMGTLVLFSVVRCVVYFVSIVMTRRYTLSTKGNE